MTLPNGNTAYVDIRKLADYCLNSGHEVGRHKARVFLAALGWTTADAETLQAALLEAARVSEAVFKGEDVHGLRYEVNFTVKGDNGPVPVVSAWIIRHGETFPRLTSCRVARWR
jgi:hypothetical protein